MRILKRFSQDKRGNIAVVFAAAAIPVVGLSGAAIDYTRATQSRGKLQVAADAAALAALTIKASTVAQRDANARAVFAANQPRGVTPSITTDVTKKVAVVTATANVEMSLLKVLQVPTLSVRAHARAVRINDGPPPCVLALSKTARPAIEMTGNAVFEGKGCTMHSNSAESPSLDVSGSSSVKADGYCAVGKVTTSRALSPTPEDGCDEMPDPYAYLGPPDPMPTTCMPDPDNKTLKLSPGLYCGGLDLRGKALTLEKGLYIVKDGPLRSNANSSVTGHEVTFYLMGNNAAFDLNGGATLNLSAMKTGAYSGLLIVQDRNSNTTGTSQLNGNASTILNGAIYLPTQKMLFNGNGGFGQNSTFMPIIANTIEMSGSTTVKTEVTPLDLVKPLPKSASSARLTE